MDTQRQQRPSRPVRPTRQTPSRRSGAPSMRRGLASNASRGSAYMLREHKIRFNDRRGSFPGSIGGRDPRRLLLIAGIVVAGVVLVLLVSSCVRGCSKSDSTVGAATTSDAAAARVASGIDATLSQDLSSALDRDDDLAWIAAHADAYSTDKLVRLALSEPAAIGFVRNQPTAEKTASAWNEDIEQGLYPYAYSWDTRWGYIDYAGLPFGVSGSGPTCLAMARAGALGTTEKSPADVAALATADGSAANGETQSTFITSEASGLGLATTSVSLTSSALTSALSNGYVVIAHVRTGTLGSSSDAHYVLVTTLGSDGSVAVHDPTSQVNSSHTWAPGTIAAASDSMTALAKA